MIWDQLKVTGLCLNLPGPLLLQELSLKGATVEKIEPPVGDPLNAAYPKWYEHIHKNISVEKLDLKQTDEVEKLKAKLRTSDIFITTARPKALKKMGLGPEEIQQLNPKLFHLGFVGHAPPDEDRPGHDLTYQAQMGLLPEHGLPKSLFVDILGTQMAWNEILLALLEKKSGTLWHPLEAAAQKLSDPLKWGATGKGALLGGGTPFYQVYEAREGRVAVACLEPHFQQRLCQELGLGPKASYDELAKIFAQDSAHAWQSWATQKELPMIKIKDN